MDIRYQVLAECINDVERLSIKFDNSCKCLCFIIFGSVAILWIF